MILSSLIFFKLISFKICISIFVLFYTYIIFLLLINLKKNIHNIYFIIFFLLYWLVLFSPGINAHDDLSSYLVFSEKFVENGEIPEETLSIRRSYNLGGSYLFKGVLSKLNPNYLNFFEPFLGIILIAILILSTNINQSKKIISLITLMVCPFLGSKILLNTEPVFLMSFFSLSLMILLNDFKNNKKIYSYSIIFFFLFIPLLYRPTTFLFNLIIFIIFLIYFFSHNYYKIIAFAKLFTYDKIIIYILIVLIFFPYLTSSLNSSGTLLYPIFGKGWQNESANFSDFPLNYYRSINDLDSIFYFLNKFLIKNFFLPLIIVLSVLLYVIEKNKIYLILSISYFINCLAISLSIGVDWVFRYSFPISLSILLFFFISQKRLNFMSKRISHTLYVSIIIFSLGIFYIFGENVNIKRNNSISLGYNNELISQIKQLENKINSQEKLLVNSIFSLAIYKSGFKNLIIYDTPLVMQPWLSDNLIKLDDFENFEKQFVNYYKLLKIDYLISDHIVYNNKKTFLKLLDNNFDLITIKKLDTPNEKKLNLYIYKLNND